MKNCLVFPWIVLLVVTATASAPREDKKQAAPTAVLDAVSKLVPKAKLLKVRQESENGITLWEAQTESVDELKLKDDGSFVAFEHKVPLRFLPKVITDALRKDGGSILKVEAVFSEAGVYFEAKVKTADGAQSECLLDSSGKTIKRD